MPRTFSDGVAGFSGQVVGFLRDSGAGSFGKNTFPGQTASYSGQIAAHT